jgi:c-di-GMP-binding flagellar brake protein YcgR
VTFRSLLKDPGENTASHDPRGTNGVSRYLSKSDDIVELFKTLRDHRTTLQLHFEHSDETFTARVLDLQKGHYLIEDIRPRHGLKLLLANTVFSLTAREAGLYVYAQVNRVSGSDAERGVPFFIIVLPATVLCQRRRTARYRIPFRVSTQGARVAIYRKNTPDEPIIGDVVDISAGGCRVSFDAALDPPASANERLQRCTITVPNILELNACGIIRHFSHNKRAEKFSCGIELTDMTVTDRRRLEQFIRSVAKLAAPER